MSPPETIDDVQAMLADEGYVCGRALVTVVFCPCGWRARRFWKVRRASVRRKSPRPSQPASTDD